MPYKYADLDETISDVLSEVKSEDDKATVGRIIEAASAMVDRFTNRPAGYFLPKGTTTGTRQKINIAVDLGDMADDATLRLTIVAAGLTGSPVTIDVNADFGTDTNATIAAAFLDVISDDETLSAFFNAEIAEDGESIDLEIATLAAPDDTFTATVEGVGVDTGITETTATVVEAGSYSPATVRRYRGTGENFLQIGRYIEGTLSIENVGSDLYYLSEESGWPFALDVAGQPGYADGGQGPDRYAGLSRTRLFTHGALYVVTARWGFAETPSDVVFATKQIVQHVWDRGRGIIGEITPTGFVIERDMPLSAKTALTGWVKREFELN